MKRDIKAWAVKIGGRSFMLGTDGLPMLWKIRLPAFAASMAVKHFRNVKAKPIRVKVRIEEIE
jgi:hypothetical protein